MLPTTVFKFVINIITYFSSTHLPTHLLHPLSSDSSLHTRSLTDGGLQYEMPYLISAVSGTVYRGLWVSLQCCCSCNIVCVAAAALLPDRQVASCMQQQQPLALHARILRHGKSIHRAPRSLRTLSLSLSLSLSLECVRVRAQE